MNKKDGIHNQVDDNPELLRRMCEAISRAPLCFQPTNYWKSYEKSFLPELYNKGLKDFRRRQDSILSSFGAVDLLFLSQIQWRFPLRGQRLINKPIRKLLKCLFRSGLEETEYFHWLV
ncbi:MAG TPA: hypothetical protein VFG29_05250 [Syntrophales bacterium]|nr:hypothetical protein [Syntrophales bacterium]